MASAYDLLKRWREDGAYVRTKDGREIPMQQLWEESMDLYGYKKKWAEVYGPSEGKSSPP